MNLRPAVVARFTVGARPKRPAARNAVVDATMICRLLTVMLRDDALRVCEHCSPDV